MTRAPASTVEALRQRLGPVVLRQSVRNVVTRHGQRYVRSIVEYGAKGHVLFVGRIRRIP